MEETSVPIYILVKRKIDSSSAALQRIGCGGSHRRDVGEVWWGLENSVSDDQGTMKWGITTGRHPPRLSLMASQAVLDCRCCHVIGTVMRWGMI
jgi:hypothetical protein